MERIMKKLPSVFKFIVGTLVVYFGIRVFWTDYVPFLLQIAGLVVALCGVWLVLNDSE